MNVVVIGASDKKDRYSYKAVEKLLRAKHKVFPVHPILEEIQGLKVFHNLGEIKEKIDIISLYVSAEKSDKLVQEILDLKPKKIIFNPGAENSKFKKFVEAKNIATIEACTLVLLSTNQFKI